VAPFGSWASPITIDLLLNGAVSLGWSQVCWDGDDLYWNELRPTEAGRQVVVRRRSQANVDVTPVGFNARTRVHEYGGGDYAVRDGTVWFSNFDDQARQPRRARRHSDEPLMRTAATGL